MLKSIIEFYDGGRSGGYACSSINEETVPSRMFTSLISYNRATDRTREAVCNGKGIRASWPEVPGQQQIGL
jgi:hypothetical protein